MRGEPGGVLHLGQDDRAELRRLSATGETFVPPQRLAALIAGAYFSAPVVPIAAL